jgi:hypothetical protein
MKKSNEKSAFPHKVEMNAARGPWLQRIAVSGMPLDQTILALKPKLRVSRVSPHP